MLKYPQMLAEKITIHDPSEQNKEMLRASQPFRELIEPRLYRNLIRITRKNNIVTPRMLASVIIDTEQQYADIHKRFQTATSDVKLGITEVEYPDLSTQELKPDDLDFENFDWYIALFRIFGESEAAVSLINATKEVVPSLSELKRLMNSDNISETDIQDMKKLNDKVNQTKAFSVGI